MLFNETQLPGAFIIELEPRLDERGFFARTWCQREFAEHGLVSSIVQSNLSFSKRAGTLRGMHYQVAPNEETKLIRCTRGALYDVIIDLRPDSSTYGRWAAFELTDRNHKMLYVPRGFANGFQTLTDDVELVYHVSAFYSPESERGIRWNDPRFGIRWPDVPSRTISWKDQNWPDFVPERGYP
jgi:dTDP-4-dehydrorhamnose 3,5-epimerase